uniref:Myb-related transcription factor, partner of profilin n=1 Tax=Lygus hesperus TaxID=30085 RepID=A0A0A9ZHZ0_LYGHE
MDHNNGTDVSSYSAIVVDEPMTPDSQKIILADPLGRTDFSESEVILPLPLENESDIITHGVNAEMEIKVEPGMPQTLEVDPEGATSASYLKLDSDSNILDGGESDGNVCTEGIIITDQLELVMKEEPADQDDEIVVTNAARDSSFQSQLTFKSESNSSVDGTLDAEHLFHPTTSMRKALKGSSGPGSQPSTPSYSEEAVTDINPRRKVKFEAEDDLFLLKEVAAENPFEDGAKWKGIANKMKAVIAKRFSARNLRERVNHLLSKSENFVVEWSMKSGTDEEQSERLALLEEVRIMKKERGKVGTSKAKDSTEAKQHRAEVAETYRHQVKEEIFFDEDIKISDLGDPLDIQDERPRLQSAPPQEPHNICIPETPPELFPAGTCVVQPTAGTSSGSGGPPRKRKRGLNPSVEKYMMQKQAQEKLLKRRQMDLEERKVALEERRLELENKSLDLQLRREETLREMIESQKLRDEKLMEVIQEFMKSIKHRKPLSN